MTDRPLPLPNLETAPFWDAAREGHLLIQRCDDCRTAIFYPRLVCPDCLGDRLTWVEAKGTGEVYSVTVVERAPGAFRDLVPYAVALVVLDEGPRMMSRLVGADPHAIRIGQRVEVRFERQDDDITLPLFAPIPS